MSSDRSRADSLPYLSEAFLSTLPISTADMVSEIERQIAGQRGGTVWHYAHDSSCDTVDEQDVQRAQEIVRN